MYPITAGWTGEAGERQMENQMEKLPELGLNSGPQGPEPRTQPLHQHTHTHTHAHTHTHTYIYTHTHGVLKVWFD